MKKILIVILCMLMIFTMTACGDNTGTEEPIDNPTVQENGNDVDSSHVTIEKLLKIAETNPENFLFISKDNGECNLLSYDGEDDMVYIPSHYNGGSVVLIDELSFSNDTKGKGVRIPDTVRVIEKNAFTNNPNIQVVYLGEGVKAIEDSAFLNCDSLYDVRLNDGLEKIGVTAFAGCENLKTVTIPSSVTTVDGDPFFGAPEDFVIRGAAGSMAETIANNYGYTFEAI